MKKDSIYNTRLRDLDLGDGESRLAGYRQQLIQELESHSISFHFHTWISTDWFCPDGVPGFAVPFYIFNSKLANIHKAQMGRVEGRTEREILKIMRHELGHAIDNAYRLRKNKLRQTIFGNSRKEYPSSYRPRFYSKNFVHYLGEHYAQSHPDEDFAETFAYWLDPDKDWKNRNHSHGARTKLAFMDELMGEVAVSPRQLTNTFRVEAIDKQNQSLDEFYKKLQEEESYQLNRSVDRRLSRCFSFVMKRTKVRPLADYLREHRELASFNLSRSENVYRYQARQSINILIQRAESLGIRATQAELRAKSPSLIQQNFRYLKQKDQLKYYL